MGKTEFDVADEVFEKCCFKCKYYHGNYGYHDTCSCILKSKRVAWNDTCNDFDHAVTRESLLRQLRRAVHGNRN